MIQSLLLIYLGLSLLAYAGIRDAEPMVIRYNKKDSQGQVHELELLPPPDTHERDVFFIQPSKLFGKWTSYRNTKFLVSLVGSEPPAARQHRHAFIHVRHDSGVHVSQMKLAVNKVGTAREWPDFHWGYGAGDLIARLSGTIQQRTKQEPNMPTKYKFVLDADPLVNKPTKHNDKGRDWLDLWIEFRTQQDKRDSDLTSRSSSPGVSGPSDSTSTHDSESQTPEIPEQEHEAGFEIQKMNVDNFFIQVRGYEYGTFELLSSVKKSRRKGKAKFRRARTIRLPDENTLSLDLPASFEDNPTQDRIPIRDVRIRDHHTIPELWLKITKDGKGSQYVSWTSERSSATPFKGSIVRYRNEMTGLVSKAIFELDLPLVGVHVKDKDKAKKHWGRVLDPDNDQDFYLQFDGKKTHFEFVPAK